MVLTATHPLSFPSAAQGSWEPHWSQLSPWLSQIHRVGDLQHSPENGLSLAQHIPGGAADGEIIPVKKLRGMRDRVPTKPALASDQGCSGQMLGASHLPLALVCFLLPPPQLAHPKTGSASSSAPGQRDAGWRQHRGPQAGSQEERPGGSRVMGSWMRPHWDAWWGRGPYGPPFPVTAGVCPTLHCRQ